MQAPDTRTRTRAHALANEKAFIVEDLEHLFDDVGVNKANFEQDVVFADPLNRFENIDAYLLNIAFLRRVFRPDFTRHAIKQTGPWEFQVRRRTAAARARR